MMTADETIYYLIQQIRMMRAMRRTIMPWQVFKMWRWQCAIWDKERHLQAAVEAKSILSDLKRKKAPPVTGAGDGRGGHERRAALTTDAPDRRGHGRREA